MKRNYILYFLLGGFLTFLVLYLFGTFRFNSQLNEKNILYTDTLKSKSSDSKIDSNSSFYVNNIKAIKIGNQTWMAEELIVTEFRNGDKIMEAKSFEEWEEYAKRRIPATCYFDFEPFGKRVNERLYNSFVTSDGRGVAPKGWRVPTEKDWIELIRYLGGGKEKEKDIARKLKAIDGWRANEVKYSDPSFYNNFRGTNSTQFNALPTGYYLSKNVAETSNRIYEKMEVEDIKHGFYFENNLAKWWCVSDRSDLSTVYAVQLDNIIQIVSEDIATGLSIRCIKE